MGSAETIDVEALLVPIPGDNPAGEDLRFTSTYDAIKDARRADDTAARGEWQREFKAANWNVVIAQATEALSNKTKDLQIGVWLLEALVKRHGFAGLRDGLRLLRELQQRFWESLYPAIEDGDLDYRAGPLIWLNDKFSRTIRDIPVTSGSAGEAYSWWHYDESLGMEKLRLQSPERLEAEIADGKISGEQFNKAANSTPLEYYVQIAEDLTQSAAECSELTRVVDEKFGAEGPGLSAVQAAIQDCSDLVEDWLKRKGGRVSVAAEAAPRAKTQNLPKAVAASPSVADGPLPLEPIDRADALRRLAAVAAFFRRTEPHSPVAYLVQRAVAWGEMSLEDWLREVISNEDVLTDIRETLGLKVANSGGSAGDAS